MQQAMGERFDHLLTSPEFITNPYPTFDILRAEEPVYWSDAWRCWVVTRYDDVMASFKDHVNLANHGRFAPMIEDLPPDVREDVRPLVNDFFNGLIHADPPNHTRLRKLVQVAFTPRAVKEMRSQVEALVMRQIDAVHASGRMEVISDLAYPLPVTVVANMLGVPAEDTAHFRDWSHEALMFQATGRTTPEVIQKSKQAFIHMRDYLGNIFKLRRVKPQDDLISALLAAEEQGDKLTEEEMLSTCVTLMIAGHETTTNLIANSLHILLNNPDHLRYLQANPAQMETAVEEFLRYESPLHRNRRIAIRDVEFGGKVVRKGDIMLQMVGAANRDPERFVNPDVVDIQRDPNPHIAFGMGIHFCLGAPLARLEAPIALNAILERMPNLRLDTDHVEWVSGVMRGMKALPIAF